MLTNAKRETTILVVEDDADCLESLCDGLEWAGYEVRTAANGLAAFVLLERLPLPDLILLDLMMPVMDGWQFLAERRARPELSGIPVILISGESRLEEKAAKLKVAGHVRKPVGLVTLLAAVERVLQGTMEMGRASRAV